jgi:hypothetical protein
MPPTSRSLTNHADQLLRDAGSYARSFFSWKADAVWIHGLEKSSGAPLSAFYFGPVDDVYEYLIDHLFASYSVRQHLERVSVWKGVGLLRSAKEQSDIVIGQPGWPYYRLLARQKFLHMPSTLIHKIPLAADWPAMEERFRQRKTTKEHLARLHKQQLTFRVTHDRDLIETFYDTMYMPHVLSRHEDRVELEPRDYLASVAEQGGLLQVMQGDTWLAGSVLHRIGPSMQGLWLGLASGLDAAMTRTALVGVYYLVMQYAIEQHCNELNLMYSPPLLNNGIFRFKSKLGSRVHDEYPFSRVGFRVTNMGPAVVKLLGRMPLTVVKARNQLTGRVLVDQDLQSPADLISLGRELTCDGIAHLDIFHTHALSESVRQADYSQIGPVKLHDLSTEKDPARRFSQT